MSEGKDRVGEIFEDVEVHTVIGRSGGMSEIGGIPENENAEGLPEDKSVGGLPEDESAGGLPEVESAGGLPEVKSAGGLPEVESAGGLPEVKSAGGLPEVESAGGLSEVESAGGLPEEVKKTGYLLAEFKERICDCIGLVCKMENRDRIAAVQFWNEVSERLQTVLDKSVGLTLEIQNKLEDGFISPLSREVVRGLRKEVNDLVLDHVDDGGCEDEVEGEEDHIGGVKKLVNYIILEDPQGSKEFSVKNEPDQKYFFLEPDNRLEEELELDEVQDDEEKDGAREIAYEDEGEEDEEEVEGEGEEEDGVPKEKFLVLHETQLSVRDGEKGLLLQDPMLRLESDDTNPDDDLEELETETKDRDFQSVKIRKTMVPGVLNSIISQAAKEQARKSLKRKMIRNETGEVETIYECEICLKTFTSFFAFTAHNWQHTKPFKCLTCNQCFSTKGSLSIHNRRHTGEKPFQCKLCDASFTTQGNLKRHSLGHTGSKPYACDICSSRFTEKKSLKVHMRIHTGERPFHCELCDQKFAQRSTLKSHMTVHNKKKPHLCDLCGRSFSQKSNLKAHKTRHFSQRNFHCDYCDCKFHNKGDLMRHMKGHVGLKDLSCTVCFKVFTRKNTLTEHMNKHYDIKPWECIRCSIKFHTRNQGKQHLKEKEGDGFHNHEALEEDLLRKLQISFSEKQVVNMEVLDPEDDVIGDMMVDEQEGVEDGVEEGVEEEVEERVQEADQLQNPPS